MKVSAAFAPALLSLLASCGAVLSTGGGGGSSLDVVTPVDLVDGFRDGLGSNEAGACASAAARSEDANATEAQRAAALSERARLGCPDILPAG